MLDNYIVFSKRNILDNINVIKSSIANKNTSLAILRAVHIVSHSSRITLSCTDLDIWQEAEMSGHEVGEGVNVAIELNTFISYLGVFKEDAITLRVNLVGISLEDNSTVINMEVDNYQLFPTCDFPISPQPDTIRWQGYVSAPHMKNMIKKLMRYVSNDEGRPVLCGINFDFNKSRGTLACVATDTHRLIAHPMYFVNTAELLPQKDIVTKKRKYDEEGNGMWDEDNNPLYEDITTIHDENLSIVIHKDNLKKMKFSTSDIDIGVNENHAFFKWDNILVIIRLIDGTFPPYQRVIPEETYTRFITGTKTAWKDMYSRLNGTMDKDSNHKVCIEYDGTDGTIQQFSCKKGRIKIRGEEFVFRIPCYQHIDRDGEDSIVKVPFQYAMNAEFVLDIIDSCDDSTIKMEFKDNNQLDVIMVKDGDNTHVLMPMEFRD